MKKFLSPVRNQMEVKTECIDDLVPPDHEVRLVWKFVENLDLSPLEETYRSQVGEAGRPAIHPGILLGIWWWGILHGIVTARALEEACKVRSDFRWICGGVSVNYHTLSDFRSREPALLKELFVEGLAVLEAAGLVDLKTLFLDGTKIRANASVKSFHRARTLQDRLAEAEAALSRLNSLSEDEKEGLSAGQIKARQRPGTERVERLQQALSELEPRRAARRAAGLKPEETRCSETDPEANRMKHADGGYRMSYNLQVLATEGKEPVIVGTAVGESSADSQQLCPIIEAHQEQQGGAGPEEVVTDNGYLSVGNVAQMEGREIRLIAPDKNQEAKRGKEFSTEQFVLADDEQSVICPGGEILPLESRKRDGERNYLVFKKADCLQCPMKGECCPKSRSGRTVKILVKEQREVMERHRARMETEEAKALIKKRKQISELINAFLKGLYGLGKVWVRGKKKVQGMVDLTALAHNVRMWIKEVRRRHGRSIEVQPVLQNV